LSKKIHQPPKRKGYIPFGLNKLSSSLPLSCIIARLVQVVKVTAIVFTKESVNFGNYFTKINAFFCKINCLNISEKRISTDVFVPSIKAIDFTKESVNFGESVF
jgi:hypothetical protein